MCGKARTPRHYQSLGIEQPDLLACRIACDALLNYRGDNQVSKTNSGRASPGKENPLLLEPTASDLERADQPGKRDTGRALDIIVVAKNLVSVLRQIPNRMRTLPILEMNTATRKHFLYGLYKFVDELI